MTESLKVSEDGGSKEANGSIGTELTLGVEDERRTQVG